MRPMDKADDQEPDGGPPVDADPPENEARRRVREKLRELYGDDSPDAVRRLFSEILAEDDEGDPN